MGWAHLQIQTKSIGRGGQDGALAAAKEFVLSIFLECWGRGHIRVQGANQVHLVSSHRLAEAADRRNLVQRVLAICERPRLSNQSWGWTTWLRLLRKSICWVWPSLTWCSCQTAPWANPWCWWQPVSNFCDFVRSRLWKWITQRRSARSYSVYKFLSFENMSETKADSCWIST